MLRSILIILGTSLATAIVGQELSFIRTQIGDNDFLTRPWDLQYGPDNHLWVTERTRGVIVRIDPETAVRDELVRITDMLTTASQDGLLGIAMHDDLLGDQPYVYCSYTYDAGGSNKLKLVRYTFSEDNGDGMLSDPLVLIEGLPASNDHNAGRLVLGPDNKLYYSIGDQGGNQNRNFCLPILSQVLPGQAAIDSSDWSTYPGKILRMNLDGSIPDDNPEIEGVRSHIFSYGHRNPQGLVFGQNGRLYSDEHGPNTDDEVNLITGGKNYGWPNVVGYLDDQAYDYCDWSSVDNCASLDYENGFCPPGANLLEESSFTASNYQEPLFSMFAVTDDYDFNDPACSNSWICRPNVAPSSLEVYDHDAIPSWTNSLLVTSLKRGRVYRLQLNEDGTAVVGDTTHLFYTPNRYRDIAMHPDGKTFYIITDQGGRTSDESGFNVASGLVNPGTILKFELDESTSTTDNRSGSFFSCSPNPTFAALHLDLEPIDESFKARILSASGKVVRAPVTLHQGRNTIQTQSLPSGFYLVQVYSRKRLGYRRIVKVDQ